MTVMRLSKFQNISWSMTRIIKQELILSRCYRFRLSMKVYDNSGHTKMRAFDEIGKDICGMSADDLLAIKVGRGEHQHASLTSRCVRVAIEKSSKDLSIDCAAKRLTSLARRN